MPSLLSFSFFGEAQLNRTLSRVSIAAQDVTPAWEVIAASFLAAERQQFDSEGEFGSGGWAPLTEPYATWKAQHYPGTKILHRTGRLEESLTDGPEIRILEPHFMVLGSAVSYGKYLQAGTDRMAQRRPVDLPEALRRSWVKVLQRYLVTGGVGGGWDEP